MEEKIKLNRKLAILQSILDHCSSIRWSSVILICKWFLEEILENDTDTNPFPQSEISSNGNGWRTIVQSACDLACLYFEGWEATTSKSTTTFSSLARYDGFICQEASIILLGTFPSKSTMFSIFMGLEASMEMNFISTRSFMVFICCLSPSTKSFMACSYCLSSPFLISEPINLLSKEMDGYVRFWLAFPSN